MKPYPRASDSEADGVAMSADLYNRMIDDLERLDRLSVTPPLTMTRSSGGTTIGLIPAVQQNVLVLIIGTETGGGYYQGSLLFGPSNGGTGGTSGALPGTANVQLLGSAGQVSTDGPTYLTATSGAPLNNALVVNLMEPYVAETHVLFVSRRDMFVMGRVMGYTAENPARAIVYIQHWPFYPVIVRITGPYLSTGVPGMYYGKILQGLFSNGSNFSYSSALSGINTAFLAGQDDCFIANLWEQTNGSVGVNSLPANSYVSGIVTGFPSGSPASGASATCYMVYVNQPVQAVIITGGIAAVTTTQTSNMTYGSNEQAMLAALKVDVNNLRTELNTLYNNLKNAGYSL